MSEQQPDRTWRTVSLAPITVGDAVEPAPRRDLTRMLIGPWLVGDKLGEGGMGAVYRARHVADGGEVALKVVTVGERPKDELDQVAREAMAAAAIRHPNVVAVHSFGEDTGRLYLALELVPGGDTKQLVKSHPRGLPEERVIALALDAALGLAAIHRAGLVHRDIKPSNIFIGADGAAKLADFGLARARAARVEDPDAAVGTPSFMSPEQARLEALDPRTDIYSLGATMFFWVTGAPPFHAEDAWETVRQVAAGPTPDARDLRPGLSDGLADVIACAMAQARDDRFVDAHDLVAALTALKTGDSTSRRTTRGARRPPPRRRRRWPLAAAAAIAASVVAAAVALGSGPMPSSAAAAPLPPSVGGDNPLAHPAPADGYAIAWLGDTRLPFVEAGVVSYTRTGARVRFDGGSLTAPAAWIDQAIAAADAFSLEVVIEPADLLQGGPARIVSLSLNPRLANLMLGQSGTRLEARVRTTTTGLDGSRPHLVSGEGVLSGGRQHVVLCRRGGCHRLYVDGVRVAEVEVPGTLATWEPALPLVVGDEHRGGFPWRGTVEGLRIAAAGWDDEEAMRRYLIWVGVETGSERRGAVHEDDAGAGREPR